MKCGGSYLQLISNTALHITLLSYISLVVGFTVLDIFNVKVFFLFELGLLVHKIQS